MSFFITLIEMTDMERRSFENIPKVHSMIHHGLTLPEYEVFLHDIYHIVWHFCPIMASAAARCGDDFRQVRYQLYENIEEEKGHEEWVLEDVAAIGSDVAAVRSLPPSAPVQGMIGFNYYACEHIHPCSVLGMLYTLEVISSVYGGRAATSVSRALGMTPPHGFKFLESHASMDLDHMANLKNLIKTIGDTSAQNAIVNATRTNFWMFGQIFMQPAFQPSIKMAS